MSQPTSLSPDRSGDSPVYRPLSGLAIVSVVVAGLYAALVLLSAGVALAQAAPLFLTGWLLLLPLSGALLALLAQWQIRNSEGTRAGMALARWGWWLSVIAGLGEGAYVTATGMAIKDQANRFLMVKDEQSGFFPRLQDGDVLNAFLLTQPGPDRGSASASDLEGLERRFDLPRDDNPQGLLSRFLEHEAVRNAVQSGRDNNSVEPLGVRSWAYANKGYKVERNYRIKTSEITLDVLVPVQSTESDQPGEGRKWFVVWTEVRVLPSTSLTPLGVGLNRLRQGSRSFLAEQMKKLLEGQTLQPPPKDLTNWDSLRVPSDEARSVTRDRFEKLLRGVGLGHPGPNLVEQAQGPWAQDNGRIRLTHAFQLMTLPTDPDKDQQYVAEGKIVVQTREPVDPLNLNVPPSWDVLSIELVRVRASPRPSRPRRS